MNISWQWLSELVDLNQITPTYLAEQLTLASFEVESITRDFQDDIILDISTTANRSDTLSMVGMAKEIAAILKKPYKIPDNRLQLHIIYKQISDKSNQCNQYLYSSISNINIVSSPKWLQEKLKQHEIQPVNNIIDILNFIALKWGQYIEVYDLNKISKANHDHIDLQIVSEQTYGKFVDRYNNTIVFPEQTLTTIKHKNHTITLAGFTSSQSTQISTKTTNILIQTTICNSQYIKEISKTLNISTKESLLQAKEVQSADVLDSYQEAILLITSLAGGKVNETIYASQAAKIYKPIYLDQQNINNILGPEIIATKSSCQTNINMDSMFKILDRLQFTVYKFPNYLQINPSLSRINDIYRTIDTVEEIIRLYGFDKFLDQLPKAVNCTNGIKPITQYTLSHIRYILRSFGMHEAMHSPLVYNSHPELQIYNPLTEEFHNLKNHLLSGLLEANKYNINQGNENLEIFETGRVFTTQDKKYHEFINVAGLIGGQSSNRSTWSHQPINLSWFQVKGQLEELCERLNLEIVWKPVDRDWFLYNDLSPYFHPKYAVMLYHQERAIGMFGEINLAFNKENNKKIYGFEIIANSLMSKNSKVTLFEEYSKYPSITRDINILIDNHTPYSALQHKIDNYNNPLIESIKLFDVYPYQQNKKNISLRITYRSRTNTLTNTDIEQLEAELKHNI